MKEAWIEMGYTMFSKKGLPGLKIEPLAKAVHKSKSSFYHHFADSEIFIDELLQYHMQQCKKIAIKEMSAKNIHPELITILVEHKRDILFSQQLRFNTKVPSFENLFIQTNKLVGEAFINVWLKDLQLNLTNNQIEGIFTLALDNFFLQINEQNFTFEWLEMYFINLKKIVYKLVN